MKYWKFPFEKFGFYYFLKSSIYKSWDRGRIIFVRIFLNILNIKIKKLKHISRGKLNISIFFFINKFKKINILNISLLNI